MKTMTALFAAAVLTLSFHGIAEAGCCSGAKGKDKAASCDLKNGDCTGYDKKDKAKADEKKETAAAKDQKKS